MNFTKHVISRLIQYRSQRGVFQCKKAKNFFDAHAVKIPLKNCKRHASYLSHIRISNIKGRRVLLQAAAGSVVILCGGVLYFVDPDMSGKRGLSVIGRNSINESRRNNMLVSNDDYASAFYKDTFNDFHTKRKIGRYTLGKIVGQGSFGVVRAAVDSDIVDKKMYAIKEVDLNLVNVSTIRDEIKILKIIGNKHRGVCSLHDVIEKNDKVYLVFEFVQGVACDTWVRENGVFSENDGRLMAMQILHALKHVHERGIIHRDIKPENILLKSRGKKEDSHFVLIDFGMAVQGKRKGRADNNVVVFKPDMQETEGTFAFWSPEMMKREQYGSAVDLWALGVSLYCVMCGSHPYDPRGDRLHAEIYRDVVAGNVNEENSIWRDELSEECKDFISRLLDTDAVQRMSCTEAIDHPWLKLSSQ